MSAPPFNIAGSVAILNLLNTQAKKVFTYSDIAIGGPVAITDDGVVNTEIEVTAYPISGYKGTTKLQYKRVPIYNAVDNKALLININSNTTIHALLPSINSAYGLALTTSDVENTAVSIGAALISLTAASTSYVYLPGSILYLGQVVPLNTLVTDVTLSGWGDVNDQFDAAMDHNAALISGFANQLFVSAATGVDGAGVNGSRTTPFATVKYAESRAVTNTAIIIANGNYTNDADTAADAISGGGLRPGSRKIGYFCKPYGVKVDCVSASRRDVHAFVSVNPDSVVSGLILNLKPNGRTADYTVAFCAGDQGGTVAGKLYNTVLTSEGNASVCYTNVSGSGLHIEYCVLHAAGSALGNYSGTPGRMIANAAKTGFNLSGTVATPASLSGQQFDAKWHTSNVSNGVNNDATVGVYAGPRKWPITT